MKKVLCVLLICMLCVPVLAETVQDQALMFIREAGIAADSVARFGDEIIVNLPSGGTAELYSYGDFDPLDFSWRFSGAADEEVALYLNHALLQLDKLEQKIPGASESRVRNYAVMVSNSLLYLENVGQQGLRILLGQLAAHEDSGLNSLRARLASRLLGSLDVTPVDPAEGLAWYDALTISVQDDLPMPDASVCVDDPFLAEVTQLLIAHEEERRSWYTWGDDVEPEKTATFVLLSEAATRQEGDRAVVLCHMISEKIALYDGARLKMLSGGWYPVRVELTKTAEGWTLARLIEPEDGTYYWSSILSFCDGDEAQARSLTSANTPELHAAHDAALKNWLASIGYPDVTIE